MRPSKATTWIVPMERRMTMDEQENLLDHSTLADIDVVTQTRRMETKVRPNTSAAAVVVIGRVAGMFDHSH